MEHSPRNDFSIASSMPLAEAIALRDKLEQSEAPTERCQTEDEEHPIVTVVQGLHNGSIVVSRARVDDDGTLHLPDDNGSDRSVCELRESLRALVFDEVYVGQRVCVRSVRGVLACELIELPKTDRGRCLPIYTLAVLNRSSNGQLVKGGTTLMRQVVYEIPASIRVYPMNPMETVPGSGEMAVFVKAERGMSRPDDLIRQQGICLPIHNQQDIRRQLALSESLLRIPHTARIPKDTFVTPLQLFSTPGYLVRVSHSATSPPLNAKIGTEPIIGGVVSVRIGVSDTYVS